MRLLHRISYGAAVLLVCWTIYVQIKDLEQATDSVAWLQFRYQWIANSSAPLMFWHPSHSEASGTKQQDSSEAHDAGDQDLPTSSSSPSPAEPTPSSKVIVMAKTSAHNTSWVQEKLPDWQHAIYSVDDAAAKFHTAQNKGHEGVAYLTYIVDHYDSLPNTILFTHHHRKAWHVDDRLGRDNARSIQSLHLDFVQHTGFVNLRCLQPPGCPASIRPLTNTPRVGEMEEIYAESYRQFFRTEEAPSEVGAPCCAQFAVSREQVLQRSKAEYEHFLSWVLASELDAAIAGRFLEFTWHIIFGREAVHCPDQGQCYCDVYGNCPLELARS